jgi:hypothetical protein
VVTKRLEAEVRSLPHEHLVAFEMGQVKELLFKEGTAAWQEQRRPWKNMQELRAGQAEEQGYLRTRIDLLTPAELLEVGEIRRRQAEQAEQARLAASQSFRPSPGNSPRM